MAKKEAVFTKDKQNKKVTVVRSFDAPLKKVWDAWTNSDVLDLWWAPKPFRAETKTMDFKEGGKWLYCMAGPAGERHWCRVEYYAIDPYKTVSSAAMFCDEEGNVNTEFPKMYWKQQFNQTGDDTTVTVEITFDSEADMETIIGMGFEEGFKMGLNNLDEVLAGK